MSPSDPPGAHRPQGPPSAAPSLAARVLAFASILVAGACGGVIGFAIADIQCDGDCGLVKGLAALAGAAGSAIGVAVVAVLTLRAMTEWHGDPRRRDRHTPRQS